MAAGGEVGIEVAVGEAAGMAAADSWVGGEAVGWVASPAHDTISSMRTARPEELPANLTKLMSLTSSADSPIIRPHW